MASPSRSALVARDNGIIARVLLRAFSRRTGERGSPATPLIWINTRHPLQANEPVVVDPAGASCRSLATYVHDHPSAIAVADTCYRLGAPIAEPSIDPHQWQSGA
jgi:hypothetical protein